jgi:hypothetical protein
MTPGGVLVARWKAPDDLKRWLSQRFNRLLAADLRTPGATIEPFQITTPELSAAAIAQHFASVRAWVDTWSEMSARHADFEITWTDWETRNFGRVRMPRLVRVLSLDAAARLLCRIDDATKARQRFESIRAVDARLAGIADQWPAFIAMSTQDFAVLCRFLAQIATKGIPKTRLREVPCAGMHTKFLENHRALLVPAMAALEIPANPDARTWAGKLGFIEDETRQFELRDLDGGLLPYPHLALPVTELTHRPIGASAAAALRGIVIVENQATFRALPPMSGVVAIFGRGDAVRILGAAAWLRTCPLLYAGDLDHAGFLMVAGLRRDGLQCLETAFMDAQTAHAFKDYWVGDSSRPGSQRAYEGLTAQERGTQQLMAAGPWRLEQERIPFDLWIDRLQRWRQLHA